MGGQGNRLECPWRKRTAHSSRLVDKKTPKGQLRHRAAVSGTCLRECVHSTLDVFTRAGYDCGHFIDLENETQKLHPVPRVPQQSMGRAGTLATVCLTSKPPLRQDPVFPPLGCHSETANLRKVWLHLAGHQVSCLLPRSCPKKRPASVTLPSLCLSLPFVSLSSTSSPHCFTAKPNVCSSPGHGVHGPDSRGVPLPELLSSLPATVLLSTVTAYEGLARRRENRLAEF